jgi:hypothetical protein
MQKRFAHHKLQNYELGYFSISLLPPQPSLCESDKDEFAPSSDLAVSASSSLRRHMPVGDDGRSRETTATPPNYQRRSRRCWALTPDDSDVVARTVTTTKRRAAEYFLLLPVRVQQRCSHDVTAVPSSAWCHGAHCRGLGPCTRRMPDRVAVVEPRAGRSKWSYGGVLSGVAPVR